MVGMHSVIHSVVKTYQAGDEIIITSLMYGEQFGQIIPLRNILSIKVTLA